MASDRNSRWSNQSISRRRWLQMAGATGASSVLAGCSGGSDQTTTTSSSTTSDDGEEPSEETDTATESKGEIVDSTFSSRIRGGVLPNELQWNHYNNQNRAWVTNTIFWDRLAMKRRDGDYEPGLAESWEVTENKVTINVHPDATWHDGKDVTAEDVALKFKLEKHTDGSSSSFYSKVNTTGKKTVELTLPEPMNKDLLKTVLLNVRIDTHPKQYKQYLKRFEEASNKEEKEKVKQDLSSKKITSPIGNGPVKFDGATVSKVNGSKHDEYHFAEHVTVPGFEFWGQEGGQPWSKMRNDQVDGVVGSADPKVAKQFPDHIRHDKIPSVGGYGFLFNFDDYDLKRYRVRQALCWMHDIQRTQSGSSNPSQLFTPPPVGHNFLDWCSDKVKNNINQYNEKVDKEKATQLLKKEGYTKKSGKWYRPNGERFKIVLDNTGDPVYQTPFKHQLEEFGIAAEIDTKESSVWAEDFFNGDFQVFVSWWGASSGPAHPWYQMQWEWDPGIDQYVEPMGKDVENFEVPMPVGDPNGSIEEINILKEFNKLGSAVTEDEFQERLDLLSWAWNQTGCIPQAWTGTHNHWADTKDWNWPSRQEVLRGPKYPWRTGWRTGSVTPKRK
ncbi:ABC transporter substrate-binding protein [Halorussus salinisoli]|uniref:ABC transporter substrate-binding protein n=1 Tax=Halorussus salinisoli TaxID=2558242 RepID=UPI0010C16188|nr:ABC transporter substrate-binding protein [Halorussus salinisoli]